MLIYDVAKTADAMTGASAAEVKKIEDGELGLMTPILKGFCTEVGQEASNHGMQCFGGHGYIAEWGMEQNVRDTRIGTLYEGTTGIQALDLIGRKVLLAKGGALPAYVAKVLSYTSGAIFDFKNDRFKKEALTVGPG